MYIFLVDAKGKPLWINPPLDNCIQTPYSPRFELAPGASKVWVFDTAPVVTEMAPPGRYTLQAQVQWYEGTLPYDSPTLPTPNGYDTGEVAVTLQ